MSGFMQKQIVIAVIAVLFSACLAEQQSNTLAEEQEITPKAFIARLQIYAEISKRILPDSQDGEIEGAYSALLDAGRTAAKLDDSASTQSLIDFPVLHPDIIAAKARAFRFFNDPIPAALPFLMSCLEDTSPHVQKEASETLILWDVEWEAAIEAIHVNNNYMILRRSKNPEAANALRYGVEHGSVEGRMLAAHSLQFFGDSTTILDVAREVLSDTTINLKDKSNLRGVSIAQQYAFRAVQQESK